MSSVASLSNHSLAQLGFPPEQTAALSGLVEQINRDRADFKVVISGLQGQVTQVQTQLRDQAVQNLKIQEQYERQIQEGTEALHSLRKEFETLQVQQLEAAKKYAELEKSHKECQAELVLSRNLIAELRTQLDLKSAAINNLTAQLAEANRQKALLETQVKTEQQRNLLLQTHVDSSKQQVETLSLQIKQAAEEKRQLAQRLLDSEAKLAKQQPKWIQSEIAKLEKEAKEIEQFFTSTLWRAKVSALKYWDFAGWVVSKGPKMADLLFAVRPLEEYATEDDRKKVRRYSEIKLKLATLR